MLMVDSFPLEQAVRGVDDCFANGRLAHGFLSSLVDEVECGLLACNADGRVLFANRSARDELATGRALREQAGVVRSAVTGSATSLDAALRDASRRGRRRMLAFGSGADRLLASVVPLRREAGPLQVDSATWPATPTVLIVLGRRGPCSALGIEMLAMIHGLTLAERRVLSDLLAGNAPRRIALNRGIAVSTVRTHIKAIREKVGVSSVEGLFVRAAEVPPVSSALRCYATDVSRPQTFEARPVRASVLARAA